MPAHNPGMSPNLPLPLMRLEPFKLACSSCNLRELCLPVGLSSDGLARLDGLVTNRRSVARGETLFCAGETFDALFAVRSGFFKTCIASEDGRDQVTGFQMAGDLLGLDGISTDLHSCNAVALEDSQVCVIPYAEQLDQFSNWRRSGTSSPGPATWLGVASIITCMAQNWPRTTATPVLGARCSVRRCSRPASAVSGVAS